MKDTIQQIFAGTTIRLLPDQYVMITLPLAEREHLNAMISGSLPEILALVSDGREVVLVVLHASLVHWTGQFTRIRVQPDKRVLLLDTGRMPPPGITGIIAEDLDRMDCAGRIFPSPSGVAVVVPADDAGRVLACLEQRTHAARTVFPGGYIT